MQASETTIRKLIEGSKQYVICSVSTLSVSA